jgi:hypothetical protein
LVSGNFQSGPGLGMVMDQMWEFFLKKDELRRPDIFP